MPFINFGIRHLPPHGPETPRKKATESDPKTRSLLDSQPKQYALTCHECKQHVAYSWQPVATTVPILCHLCMTSFRAVVGLIGVTHLPSLNTETVPPWDEHAANNAIQWRANVTREIKREHARRQAPAIAMLQTEPAPDSPFEKLRHTLDFANGADDDVADF